MRGCSDQKARDASLPGSTADRPCSGAIYRQRGVPGSPRGPLSSAFSAPALQGRFAPPHGSVAAEEGDDRLSDTLAGADPHEGGECPSSELLKRSWAK